MDRGKIAEILNAYRSIEGMMLEESAAIWCILLEEQHASWSFDGLTSGGYLEIGVFKGKSASILASFSDQYQNDFYVIDPVIEESTITNLNKFDPDIRFVQRRSELVLYSDLHREHLRSMSFIHIDGMHTFSALTNDLQLCEDMLADFGILCIDDFHTDLYPQLPAAIYRYLYLGHSDLSIFLLGFNKVYLCRNEAKRHYYNFVRDHLINRLAAFDLKLSLVKTDRNDFFDAFAVVPFTGDKHFGDPFR
jgi:hypothetical protein